MVFAGKPPEDIILLPLAVGPLVKNITTVLDAVFKKLAANIQPPNWLEAITPVFNMEFQDVTQALDDDVSKLGKFPHSMDMSNKLVASLKPWRSFIIPYFHVMS